MLARPETHSHPVALALNLELSRGRHGASARIELHDRPEGRIALVQLRGWIDRHAVERLARSLDDLAARGADQVLLDCAQVRHLDYRLAPGLVRAVERFERHAGGVVVCGLSHYLRDLFRLSGCESRLRCWPSSAELLSGLHGTPGECAS